jgi:putative ABC transport system permease protein
MSPRQETAAPSHRRPVRSLAGLALAVAHEWWPQLVALALSAAIVSATIVGAAGAGSAVQRGLRRLAVARLGGIETVIRADYGASGRLVNSVVNSVVTGHGTGVPAFVATVAVATADSGRPPVRATLLACDAPESLGFHPALPRGAGGVFVNEPLATLLGCGAGAAVVVRIPRGSDVPADSPLGRRSGESIGRRVVVDAVLPATGLGQFALRPTLVTEPLVVLPLTVVATMLQRADVANTILLTAAGSDSRSADPGEPADQREPSLRAPLGVDLSDVGLVLDESGAAAGGLRLTSRRLILPPEADRIAAAVLAPLGGRPSLVFLANALAVPDAAGRPTDAMVPYSTIAGIDATSLPLGDVRDEAGQLLPLPADDDIIIDQWTAADLAAQGRPVAVGDRLLVTLFAPETVAGRVEETTHVLRVSGIAAVTGAAAARGFVPDVEGVTDEQSIADWDPPFPFDRSRVRATPPHDEDERYWKLHGPAPKAFVHLDTARRLAGSRFGQTTAWHLPAGTAAAEATIRDQLTAALVPTQIPVGGSAADGPAGAGSLGVSVEPVRAEALAAARGSTPFGGLFLGLSSFIIVAGLLLLWLLFGLLVAARRRDIGLLAALGWPPARLAGWLLLVGGGAAALGVAAGAAIGPWWTWALLTALAGSWRSEVAAGAADAFTLAPPAVTAVGTAAATALACGLAAVGWGAWRAGHAPPLGMLRGTDGVGVGVGAWSGGRPIRSLLHLAVRGLGHAPRRTMTVAAIVALAEFLLVAVSSFTLRPPADLHGRTSPTGGWTWLARFGADTMIDPSDPETRAGLGLTVPFEAALAESRISRLRSSGGDEVSCTNLYATDQPTVLGVDGGFIARGGFAFAAHAARPGTPEADNPWLLLERPSDDAEGDRVVPAILDQATAQWALKLGGVGARFEIVAEDGRRVSLDIVGLLDGSILQGFVVVSEDDFLAMFPGQSGYRLAVVDASGVPAALESVVPAALAAAWADAAVAVESTAARLRSLQAVQNTFLTGFQLLGGLGLLLGTAGVAAVQAQGVVERRGALSLLRAVGFGIGRVRLLLVLETVVMVGIGLVVGATAGGLAVAALAATSGGRWPGVWITVTCAVSLVVASLAGLAVASRQVIPERPQAD